MAESKPDKHMAAPVLRHLGFSQDPDALAQKHEPELHEELNAEWRKIQCELLASGTIVRPLARLQAPEAMN